MPKSKTRVTRTHLPRLPDKPAAAFPAEKVLETATLALTQASIELVREAEAHITLAARNGEGVAEAVAVHLLLRSASLGFLAAYSRLSGLPNPMETHAPFTD